jgi:hypothetical protein
MLTKQEMFDRAYRGLASQGWRRAVSDRGCSYATDDGRRCAWGWVDMSLGASVTGPVSLLRAKKIGLAADLDDGAFEFADDLQACHDSTDDQSLEREFAFFAVRHNLTIPVLP